MTTFASSKTRGTDSTDRTPALSTVKTASTSQRKSPTARFGGAAKRLLNTLMRSLASPHI